MKKLVSALASVDAFRLHGCVQEAIIVVVWRRLEIYLGTEIIIANGLCSVYGTRPV